MGRGQVVVAGFISNQRKERAQGQPNPPGEVLIEGCQRRRRNRRIGQIVEPRALTVVSSDSEIAAAARRKGVAIVGAAEFARRMAETHGPRRRKLRRPSPEPRLSSQEVEEWLAVFNRRKKRP